MPLACDLEFNDYCLVVVHWCLEGSAKVRALLCWVLKSNAVEGMVPVEGLVSKEALPTHFVWHPWQ